MADAGGIFPSWLVVVLTDQKICIVGLTDVENIAVIMI